MKNSVTIHIDGKEIITEEGTTIVEAASSAGIDIPTLCYNNKCKPESSCMVCLVKIHGRNGFAPACATKVTHQMQIDSNTDEVKLLRKKALELLLSEHLGDCMGPCQVSCPAKMDIPAMLRAVSKGDMELAGRIVLDDIPLPAILGEICPGPCEKICRHKATGTPIPICKIKGQVGRYILDNNIVLRPEFESEKSVAIVGAGPAGLSAGYYLRKSGFQVTIYDRNRTPGGGMLEISTDILPKEILEKECTIILEAGIKYEQATIGKEVTLADLTKRYDAVLLACGPISPETIAEWGISDPKGNKAYFDKETMQLVGNSDFVNVFAAGATILSGKMAVRAVGMGHRAAVSINQLLCGQEVSGLKSPFNIRIGKFEEDELSEMIQLRNSLSGGAVSVNSSEPVAGDCLHCDCRDLERCLLRKHSDELDATPTAYKLAVRKKYHVELSQSAGIIYEQGKCIKCGLCIQVSKTNPQQALTFTGRGYNTRVVAPMGMSFDDLPEELIREIIDICPTGAMSAV